LKRHTIEVCLFFSPIANVICWLLLSIGIAKKFGEETLYGIGIFFLAFIFFPILGFGSAKYKA